VREYSNLPVWLHWATIIVPILLKALQETNGIISRCVPAAALKAIEPEAANVTIR
jgi:hypothetical protein